MKLPRGATVIVTEEKVRGYLLAAANPRSRGKPAFFVSLGFSFQNWEILRDELLKIGATGDAKEGQPSSFGRKFEIRATLSGPSGKVAQICTVWIIESGDTSPRFVTAYPI